MSFARSTMKMYPPSSTDARSPLRYHPSDVNAPAVSSGRFQYPGITLGPRTTISPISPISQRVSSGRRISTSTPMHGVPQLASRRSRVGVAAQPEPVVERRELSDVRGRLGHAVALHEVARQLGEGPPQERHGHRRRGVDAQPPRRQVALGGTGMVQEHVDHRRHEHTDRDLVLLDQTADEVRFEAGADHVRTADEREDVDVRDARRMEHRGDVQEAVVGVQRVGPHQVLGVHHQVAVRLHARPSAGRSCRRCR